MATYTGADPGAGAFGILQTQADAAYKTAKAQIHTQRGGLLDNEGLSGEYDPVTGAYTGYHIDPNAASGGYQQMMQGNAQQGAADDAAISQLGFGGGLAAQAHNQAQGNYSANATNWLNGVTGALTDYGNQDIAATKTHNDTIFSGLMDDVQKAIELGQFNPANYDGVHIDGYDVQGDLATIPGSTVADPTDPGSTGGAFGNGGGSGTGHPHYDAWKAAHPNNNMTFHQWLRSGKPGHRG